MASYSTGLVSESFWFLEVKKIIKLLQNGASWDEIRTMALEENLLELSKATRAKRVYGYLKNRISTLDENMLALFIRSDIQTQKLINLIAVAKQNKLFYEFLYEVYSEKVHLREEELSSSDINVFFKNKAAQDELVASWSEITLKRLRSTYMNFLTDAGLLTVVNKTSRITPPILDRALERYLLENREEAMIKALTGVEK